MPSHDTSKRHGHQHEQARLTAADEAEFEDVHRDHANRALQVASDVIRGNKHALEQAPPEYATPLWMLWAAFHGPFPAKEKLAELEGAVAGLRQAQALGTPGDEDWVQDWYLDPIENQRAGLQSAEVYEKIQSTVILPGSHEVIVGSEGTPQEKGSRAREVIKLAMGTIGSVHDAALGVGEEAIKEQAEQMYKEGEIEAPIGIGGLADLKGPLMMMDGLLTITDPKALEEAAKAHGLEAVKDYTELVEAAMKLTVGSLTTASTLAAVIAKHYGRDEMALKLLGGTRLAAMSKGLGVVFGVMDMVKGAIQMFTGKTKLDKADGAVGLISGDLGLLGAAGVEWAGPAGFAVSVGWMEFKLVLAGIADLGATITSAWEAQALKALARDGDDIAEAGDKLARITAVLQVEKDPELAKILQRQQDEQSAELGEMVDRLIGDVGIHEKRDASFASDPGNYAVLREAFAPIVHLRGKRTLADAPPAAAAVLERLQWVFEHQNDLIVGGAFGMDLDEIKDREAEAERDKKEGGD